ncbi:MAG: lipid A biosynthesis acyltransferase [Nitrosomonadales bacterium]|nr:lipid A biosynthesis acyltransferase [Nitrosomonadales bacterium]
MMTRIGIFVLWLLHFLPLPVLARIGDMLGWLLYALGAERRHVADTNLRLCFPELSEHERAVLVRKNFQMFARSLLERSILWWSSAERIQSLIRVEGWHHMQAVQPGPVIMLAPHFVALDVGGSWLTQHVNLVSIYSNQKNKAFGDMLLHGRSRFGQQQLYPRQQGLRSVVKAIRDGLPFYYLPDQDLATKDGVFVPFFGVQAATLNTVARLAKMTGARVVPCISRILPGGEGYEVRFYPPWENYPTDDIVADTRRVNEFIEQRVREMPEQYFWLHKRFKTRPEGEQGFY